MFLSVVWLDETVISVLLMAWPALVCCVLAQVRPLSDVWQGIKLTAVLVPVALLLPLFFFFFLTLRTQIVVEEILLMAYFHTRW